MVPEDFAERVVVGRRRTQTAWNWKQLRQALWDAKELVFATGECDAVTEFGALSFVALKGDEAVLTRLVPRFPGHTDIETVHVGRAGTAAGEDRLGAHMRDSTPPELARPFYEWYWAALAPARA